MTLDELKAQNAADEAAELETPIVDKTDIVEDEYVEVVEEIKADDTKAIDGDKSEDKVELESWQLTEESVDSEDDQKKKFVPNHEAARRRKQSKALRGELKEKDSELDTLRAELEALKGGSQPVIQEVKKLTRPTREQFDYDDDKYDIAVDAYHEQRIDNKLSSFNSDNTAATKAQNAKLAFQERQEKSFDSHYGEAQQLIDDGKISTGDFKDAESIVIQALEDSLPGNGQNTFNQLIVALGKDSAKIAFQLGKNPELLYKLQSELAIGDGGLSASRFLGGLQQRISTPNKKRSQAPTPGSKVAGDSSGGKHAPLLAQYNKLNEDDVKGRMTLKRQARSKGADTSKW